MANAVKETLKEKTLTVEKEAMKEKIEVKSLNFYYGKVRAVKNVNISIYENSISALIGPSGCGKTTVLRCFNRIHDLYPGNRYEGEVILDGMNILANDVDPIELRSRIGMVFQKPTPFPMSIFDNVAFGLKLMGINSKTELGDRVEQALKNAALWDEVESRLGESAFSMSGGQQQRLCIARAIATQRSKTS